MYWYCDIVDYDYNLGTNHLVVTDLLTDVIIYPDGFVKVVDLDELAIALESGVLPEELLKKSLRCTNDLLQMIYHDEFGELQKYLTDLC